MSRYVAFLRGMNLGGRRIKNEELRRHFEEMGFEEVAPFRASGNVIFSTPSRESESKLAQRVEAELDESSRSHCRSDNPEEGPTSRKGGSS